MFFPVSQSESKSIQINDRSTHDPWTPSWRYRIRSSSKQSRTRRGLPLIFIFRRKRAHSSTVSFDFRLKNFLLLDLSSPCNDSSCRWDHFELLHWRITVLRAVYANMCHARVSSYVIILKTSSWSSCPLLRFQSVSSDTFPDEVISTEQCLQYAWTYDFVSAPMLVDSSTTRLKKAYMMTEKNSFYFLSFCDSKKNAVSSIQFFQDHLIRILFQSFQSFDSTVLSRSLLSCDVSSSLLKASLQLLYFVT